MLPAENSYSKHFQAPGFALTQEQEALVVAARDQGQRVVVDEAGAGTGKSSTIRECVKVIPPGFRLMYTAFNRSVIDDAKGRMGRAEVKTTEPTGLRG